jgi:hypothetical protein
MLLRRPDLSEKPNGIIVWINAIIIQMCYKSVLTKLSPVPPPSPPSIASEYSQRQKGGIV